MALCCRPLRVPPAVVMSAAVKSLTGSLSTNVTVAVSPAANTLVSALTSMRGGVVSMLKGVIGVDVVTPLVVTLSCGV